MTQKLTTAVLLTGLALSLAACGHTTGSRALSGGAIGAGAGAIIGGATGLGAGTGALIGGAGGAGAGALTNSHQVNLGHAP
jgi:osmotically inducible lipoprotein OsmB